MEIELKYLTNRETGFQILKELENIRFGARREIPMRAVYFDTKERSLRDVKMAYRVRREGESYVATVKYGGGSDKVKEGSGLHRRGEVNVEVGESFIDSPRVDVFDDSDCYRALDKAVGGQYSDELGVMRPRKPLIPLIEMEFRRTEYEIRLDERGETRAMLSYDEGEIRAAGDSAPISEIEIELICGSEDDLIDFGENLLKNYGLKPGIKSKYARGLKLLNR